MFYHIIHYNTVCVCKIQQTLTDGWMDRQTVEHWTDILIDDWQMNRWTDWQMDWETGYLGVTDSTEVWRFFEFSSCSFSFWEYSRGWYCVVALRGYFQSVWVPSSTNSGIDYNNKQIKLTYSYQSAESHHFINILTTSYSGRFVFKESNNCTSLCWHFTIFCC